jgi:hypothetical protein
VTARSPTSGGIASTSTPPEPSERGASALRDALSGWFGASG